MADIWYYNNTYLAYTKQLNFNSDTKKVMLLNNSYVPNSGHSQLSDISGYEVINGNGYTTGGVTVTGLCELQPSQTNIKLDIENPSWIASSGDIGPFRYAVLYDQTINCLIYGFDFESTQTAISGSNIIINIDPSGLVTIG